MVKIWTDGSGNGGWGAVVVYSEDHVEEIGGSIKNPTNNRAELTAVIKSISYVAEDGHMKDKLIVYTDSAYIVNCFKDRWYKNWQRNGWKTYKKQPVKNRDLWEELIELYKRYKPSIRKVKAHIGNTYNERADRLATEHSVG